MKTDNNPLAAKSISKKFSFEEFSNSFKSLDPQNMGNWPLPVKITAYIFVGVLVFVLAYLLLIAPVREDIVAAEGQEQSLLNDYRDKDSKLRNLLQYQKQVEEMESTFGQLLQQLPKETEIPGLVEDINYTGVGSGLQFDKINVEKEVTKDFFIELPMTIKGRGDYHSFGAFVSALAALPRIVTIDDFDISPINDKSKSEVPVLGLTVNAKTYRYNDKADPKNKPKTPQDAAKKTGSTS
ncbi:type 4a pilus biogenesis protein PilO [Aquirhabdus sp.]|uniref:type 4a pilus biogenesis protein PilO n=1 Tax=Aquirhabdus sp. TaxID=2824160 RepID=UPI00396C36F6